MRMLVIYCHPCPESFTAAIRDKAMAALAAAGHEVRLIDLHAEDFDPVMRAEERRAYHTAGVNEAPVAAHLDALRWCEGLLFVYPTWWYGLPAMLKGWLDRVWIPHATFTMPEGGKPIGRVLTNIRFIGVVSTLGSPVVVVAAGDVGARATHAAARPEAAGQSALRDAVARPTSYGFRQRRRARAVSGARRTPAAAIR